MNRRWTIAILSAALWLPVPALAASRDVPPDDDDAVEPAPAPPAVAPDPGAVCRSTALEDRRECRRQRRLAAAEARKRAGDAAWSGQPRDWFWLGADLGLSFIGSRIPYRGRATVVEDAIAANVYDMSPVAATPILRQTFRFHRFFAIELSERFWTHEFGAVFPRTPYLDFSLRRYVIPITLAARAIFESRHAGFSLGVGPGLYVIRTHQSGFLGDGEATRATPGAHAFLTLLLRPSPRVPVHLSLELAYDWFRMPSANPLLNDGGDASTVTFSFGVGYRF